MGTDVSERLEDGLDLGPDEKAERLRNPKATSTTHVKRIALEYAGAKRRAAGFKRVSKSFLDAVEANTRRFILDRVERHPSRGVTLT